MIPARERTRGHAREQARGQTQAQRQARGQRQTQDQDQARERIRIRIGGWARLSTCDWPGRLVTTLFCQGCPWRCVYCHNPQLLPVRSTNPEVPWASVVAHLERRRGLLDGVVLSGGEPLLQPGLAQSLRAIRSLGFATGLHTAGAYPRRFAELLEGGLLDWVGLDIKAAPGSYDKVTRTPNSARPAARSLRMLRDSGTPHELRTTVDPAVLSTDDLAELTRWLAEEGVREREHVTKPVR